MGGVISTKNVVISTPFDVEITNNSAILNYYLSFPHQIVIMSVEISFSFAICMIKYKNITIEINLKCLHTFQILS